MIELKGTKCMQCSIIKDCELKKELEKKDKVSRLCMEQESN